MCSQSFETITSYSFVFYYYSSTVIDIKLSHKRSKPSKKLLCYILYYNL